MTYVNGMVAAVPAVGKQKYVEHARMAAEAFREHGALSVVECWEVDVPDGKVTSFPMAVQKKDDEVIVFSWITWPSKAVADAGMEKIMSDPRMSEENNPMPFDGKRMIHGGFDVVFEA
ncbi:DUF1428 domain-containing protein [Oricola thermophila]|uniref:DUF1428 domain-containing protein n=1 Tax=Oricola thermophila TaxID=2742145 RepID=A0A6N1VFN6_9HYPH|nr:DUF1428 domain-containing protein [Oricola thermophila]QKV19756.1 DUF1428 domain-containing protein [Oricola thermophila]